MTEPTIELPETVPANIVEFTVGLELAGEDRTLEPRTEPAIGKDRCTAACPLQVRSARSSLPANACPC
jgi:hypothetical protein